MSKKFLTKTVGIARRYYILLNLHGFRGFSKLCLAYIRDLLKQRFPPNSRILERGFEMLENWLNDNFMTLKPHKCKFKSFGRTSRNDVFCLNKAASKKLHGITIEDHLTFNRDITNICKSAKRKLNAQSRVSSLLAKNSERFYQNRLFNRCKSQLLSSYLDV